MRIHNSIHLLNKVNKNVESILSKAREQLSKFAGGSVTLEQCNESGVGKIFLFNEGKKNSLTGKMMVDFYDCVEQLKTWKNGRVVLISGKDGDFCTGGDLAVVKQIANPTDGYLMCTFMGEIMKNLRRMPIISIADVRGYALGGGTEIVCSCDIKVAHKDAKLGFVQGKMGVTPGWSGVARLVEIVGRSKAIELLATSTVLSAHEAKELRILNYVYEKEDDLQKYLEKAEIMQASKKAVVSLDDQYTFDEKHSAEREVFTTVWGGPHHLEALEKNVKHNK